MPSSGFVVCNVQLNVSGAMYLTFHNRLWHAFPMSLGWFKIMFISISDIRDWRWMTRVNQWREQKALSFCSACQHGEQRKTSSISGGKTKRERNHKKTSLGASPNNSSMCGELRSSTVVFVFLFKQTVIVRYYWAICRITTPIDSLVTAFVINKLVSLVVQAFEIVRIVCVYTVSRCSDVC